MVNRGNTDNAPLHSTERDTAATQISIAIYGSRSISTTVTAALVIFIHTAHADTVVDRCSDAPSISNSELSQTQCRMVGSVTVETYSTPALLSPYATAFDQRSLTVAYSKDARALKAASGSFLLLRPPMAEQISKKEPMSKTSYGHWIISSEMIEYGSPGGAPGFVLSCSTAIRSRPTLTLAVAECYPLEQRERFLQALDSVR